MKNQSYYNEKIIPFPFRMNWIATISGGQVALDIFWSILDAVNDIAIKEHQMTVTDKQRIQEMNEIFEKWDLPIFPIDEPPLSLIESNVINFGS